MAAIGYKAAYFYSDADYNVNISYLSVCLLTFCMKKAS